MVLLGVSIRSQVR